METTFEVVVTVVGEKYPTTLPMFAKQADAIAVRDHLKRWFGDRATVVANEVTLGPDGYRVDTVAIL